MNPEKYHRDVQLVCPSCGCSNFDNESIHGSTMYTCALCSRTLSMDELKRLNSENINAHIDEIKKDVIKDAKKELEAMLKKSFSGHKNIKFK